MKYLAIIADRDFELWQNIQESFLELSNDTAEYKLLIWKEENEFQCKEEIEAKIGNEIDFLLGVIFHRANGNAEAAILRNSLITSFNDKLAFCEWYSGIKTNFWSDTNADANLPYNNLKRAWKDNNGDKEKTFEAVWDCFMVDQAIETPLKKLATSLPFDYVYNNDADLRNAKNDLIKAVEQNLRR